MDILSMLEVEHREVEGMFAEYEQGHHDVVSRISEALKLHTQIEEKVLYPCVREALPDGDEEAAHAKQEHDKVDEFLAELEQNPNDDACFADLKSEVEHHVQEEETEMFPKLRDAVSVEKLEELGDKMEEMKAS